MATEKVEIIEEESDPVRLQGRVNKWLAKHPDIEITQRLMGYRAAGITGTDMAMAIAIFYIEKPAKRAAKVSGTPRARGKLTVAK